MAMKRSALTTLLVILVAALLLVALNPDQKDFSAFLSGKGTVQAKDTGLKGVMSGAMTAVTGLTAGLYKRSNYLLFSTYHLGGEKGKVYLGAAKVVFIRLK
jgi:hypothetical protein